MDVGGWDLAKRIFLLLCFHFSCRGHGDLLRLEKTIAICNRVSMATTSCLVEAGKRVRLLWRTEEDCLYQRTLWNHWVRDSRRPWEWGVGESRRLLFASGGLFGDVSSSFPPRRKRPSGVTRTQAQDEIHMKNLCHLQDKISYLSEPVLFLLLKTIICDI